MIDIANGRYWDLPLSWVDGCTPCSPGCDHCWAAGIAHRFHRQSERETFETGTDPLTDSPGRYTGRVITRPERLSIPLKRRKPTVYAVWNDLHHEAVPMDFKDAAYSAMVNAKQHTFLVLTKRYRGIADYMAGCQRGVDDIGGKFPWDNIYHGLTVCNQWEMEEKSKDFFSMPGNKFLSLEPLLSKVVIPPWVIEAKLLSCVILGGETGPGARPLHPDWVRSVRDQCAAAGVPFFFKQWGEWAPCGMVEDETKYRCWIVDGTIMCKVGKKAAGRLLDGRTHDDLPWVIKEYHPSLDGPAEPVGLDMKP